MAAQIGTLHEKRTPPSRRLPGFVQAKIHVLTRGPTVGDDSAVNTSLRHLVPSWEISSFKTDTGMILTPVLLKNFKYARF
jgi:hypothetical protein